MRCIYRLSQTMPSILTLGSNLRCVCSDSRHNSYNITTSSTFQDLSDSYLKGAITRAAYAASFKEKDPESRKILFNADLSLRVFAKAILLLESFPSGLKNQEENPDVVYGILSFLSLFQGGNRSLLYLKSFLFASHLERIFSGPQEKVSRLSRLQLLLTPLMQALHGGVETDINNTFLVVFKQVLQLSVERGCFGVPMGSPSEIGNSDECVLIREVSEVGKGNGINGIIVVHSDLYGNNTGDNVPSLHGPKGWQQKLFDFASVDKLPITETGGAICTISDKYISLRAYFGRPVHMVNDEVPKPDGIFLEHNPMMLSISFSEFEKTT
eukprot:Tbor_TRINITY_DN1118_c0_g1::TRINITY_DN1118_c0_g1_i1::g.15649::m.15649